MPCFSYYYQASTLDQSKMNERKDFQSTINIFYDPLLTQHAGYATHDNIYDKINSNDDIYIMVVKVYLNLHEGNIIYEYVKTNDKDIKTNPTYSDNLFVKPQIIRQFLAPEGRVRNLIIHSD